MIVVGAGPAGSMLAYWLASSGIKVLIVEKEKLPRYKTCGGGVTVRAQRLIPFDISEVFERTIYDIEFSFRMGRSFVKHYPEPICFMTMRDKLDYLLACKAQEAGADLIQETKVMDIISLKEKVSIITSRGTFEALFVAGCDGANSIVAHKMGLSARNWTGVAIEMECMPCRPDALERWSGKVHIDVGSIPGGYAWIFPKAEHISVGAGGPVRFSKRLRGYLDEYLKIHNIQSVKLLGHKLPIRKPGGKISGGRILLVGDAACLVEPFSGEGIYSAIKSAKFAAQSLSENIANGCCEISSYEDRINKNLMPELHSAALAVKLFALAPHFFIKLIERHGNSWNFSCQIFRGEETYITLRRKLLIPERIINASARWNPLGW